jgi:hypothetical protein
MKKILLIFIIIFIVGNVWAEKPDSCFYAQVDLANRWIWRGVSYSESPVIQPTIGWKNRKLSASVFGSYAFEPKSYSEVDFTIEFQLMKKLKLGLTDYFGFTDSLGAKHNFFNLNRKTTMHMLDLYGIYYPSRRVPLSILYSFWFWGADREPHTLKQNFSSYSEVKYEKAYGQYKASVFAGITLGKGFYASHPAIVNLGVGLSKSLSINKSFSIPTKIEFILNPEEQNVYVNAIISIK